MPSGRGFLERLRPVGTPGAAARRGVPADRAAEFGAELEPLFELLAEVDTEAARIRLAAEQDARRVIGDSRTAADAVVADAAVRAEAARAAASASGRDEAATEETVLARQAGEQLACLRRRATGAMPEHVGRAVAIARAELRAITELPGEPGST
jgi:hypothetical protein